MAGDLADLVGRADLDELVREIDRRCSRGEYAEVLALRDGCRDATVQLGRQLWGPAQYAEYRLALEAPGPLAATVVVPGAGRFALGPLTEVLAQHHRFDEVADHLDVSVRPVVAQERALRGEDLDADPRADAHEVGVPAVLQPWEPTYPVPTYRAGECLEPEPPIELRPPTRDAAPVDVAHPGVAPVDAARAGGGPVDAARAGGGTVDAPPDPPAAASDRAGSTAPAGLDEALRELVAPWLDESRGEVGLAVVDGGAADACGALDRARRDLTPLRLPQALARMAWAGASGGAHGRRRGGAAGRAGAWWVAHVATGLAFPADPDELEFHLEELSWYAFGDHEGRTGWQLRLAVAGDGWAAAIDAHDRDEDDHAT
jgi:hypothetical protein